MRHQLALDRRSVSDVRPQLTDLCKTALQGRSVADVLPDPRDVRLDLSNLLARLFDVGHSSSMILRRASLSPSMYRCVTANDE